MKKNFEQAKRWYQQHGVSNKPWDEYDSRTKELLALEATFDEWPEVSHMMETGMSEAVVVYFNPATLACTDTDAYSLAIKEPNYDLTAYLAQHAQGNLRRLLTESWARVENVEYSGQDGGRIKVVVSPV